MKRSCARLLILLLVSLISLLPPALAQTAERATGPFSYHASKEVTLNATVLSVLTNPSPGMIMGFPPPAHDTLRPGGRKFRNLWGASLCCGRHVCYGSGRRHISWCRRQRLKRVWWSRAVPQSQAPIPLRAKTHSGFIHAA
jgi:hypothetical protein